MWILGDNWLHFFRIPRDGPSDSLEFRMDFGWKIYEMISSHVGTGAKVLGSKKNILCLMFEEHVVGQER